MMLLFQAVMSLIEKSRGLSPFQRVPLPRSGGAFRWLVSCDIGTGAFNHQTQIVFATNCWQRTTTSSVEPFTTAVAPSLLQPGSGPPHLLADQRRRYFRPHNSRHLYGEQPEWASADATTS